jgi:predicted transcriptional regulator
MSTRINARLDRELAKKLQRAQATTHKSVTEIVSESLEQYCDVLIASDSGRLTPYQRMADAGFIGCAEGSADLSTTYKSELAESLGRKA